MGVVLQSVVVKQGDIKELGKLPVINVGLIIRFPEKKVVVW